MLRVAILPDLKQRQQCGNRKQRPTISLAILVMRRAATEQDRTAAVSRPEQGQALCAVHPVAEHCPCKASLRACSLRLFRARKQAQHECRTAALCWPAAAAGTLRASSRAGAGRTAAMWRMKRSACRRGALSAPLKMLSTCFRNLRCSLMKGASSSTEARSRRSMKVSMAESVT